MEGTKGKRVLLGSVLSLWISKGPSEAMRLALSHRQTAV